MHFFVKKRFLLLVHIATFVATKEITHKHNKYNRRIIHMQKYANYSYVRYNHDNMKQVAHLSCLSWFYQCRDIFLTTFYGLYFSQQLHTYISYTLKISVHLTYTCLTHMDTFNYNYAGFLDFSMLQL